MQAPAVSLPYSGQTDAAAAYKDRKSYCDLFVEYIKDAANGTSHLFCMIGTAAKFFPETKRTNQVRTYTAIAGSALCGPQLVGYVTDLNKSVTDLKEAIALPTDDEGRSQKVSKTARKATVGALDTVNSATELSLFLHTAEILHLGEAAPVTEGIFQITSGLSDLIDLVEQIKKLGRYKNKFENAVGIEKKSYFEHKFYRTMVQVAKDVFSVALASLALLSLFFGALFEGVVFIPFLVLGLSLFYIVAKISSYFYQMILKEEKKYIF